MTPAEYQIALNLLERAGAFLNYFISVDKMEVDNASALLHELSEFLKKVRPGVIEP